MKCGNVSQCQSRWLAAHFFQRWGSPLFLNDITFLQDHCTKEKDILFYLRSDSHISHGRKCILLCFYAAIKVTVICLDVLMHRYIKVKLNSVKSVMLNTKTPHNSNWQSWQIHTEMRHHYSIVSPQKSRSACDLYEPFSNQSLPTPTPPQSKLCSVVTLSAEWGLFDMSEGYKCKPMLWHNPPSPAKKNTID